MCGKFDHLYRFVGLASLILSIAVGSSTNAANNSLPLVARLTAIRPDLFPRQMAVDGDRVLVGVGSGAHLYVRQSPDGTSWSRQYVDMPTGGANLAVGLAGDTAILGDPLLRPAGQQSGAAAIFAWSNETQAFQHTQYIWSEDAGSFEQFGIGVALGDDFAIVGANTDSLYDGGQRYGTVTFFRKNDSELGEFVEVKKFAPADLRFGDEFGRRLALDGDTLAVTVRENVYVFDRHSGGTDNWGQVAKLGPVPVNSYTPGIAVDGDTLFVGTTSGSVFIHERNDGGHNNWGLVSELQDPGGALENGFGYAVDVQGNLAVVAAFRGIYGEFGKAYVYHRNAIGRGNWDLIGELTSPDSHYSSEYFGNQVKVMDNLILVGSSGSQTHRSGTVYVFRVPEPRSGLLAVAIITLWPAISRCMTRRHYR